MIDVPGEWQKQSVYDFGTAKYMFAGKRYFYAVFMCHLAVEKALKGKYALRLGKVPPKTHNLLFLIAQIGIQPPEPLPEFVFFLNRVSVPTRYPEEIRVLLKTFTRVKTATILKQSQEFLQWLKKQ